MNKSEIKDRVQRNGLNKWFQRGQRGTLEYCTGVGKSRCGVLAAEWLVKNSPEVKILILTPTQTIRDQAWIAEFRKWGTKSTLKYNVHIVCIQTAYKWTDQEFDLVIADEVHNYLSDEYIKFFQNNTCTRILGLSASISYEQRMYLNKIAPVVDTITTNKARELGLVSDFIILNLGVELTNDERERYNAYSKIIGDAQARSFTDWKTINLRKDILYNAVNKVKAVETVHRLLNDQYGVIFSQSTMFADNISKKLGDSCLSYHSKISAKKRKENLKLFCDGRTKVNVLSTARALDEGANLPRVTYAIIAAGTSKEKSQIQRLGRIIRYEDGKEALLIRLYAKGTKDEQWLRTSQYKYNAVYIDSPDEIIDYA